MNKCKEKLFSLYPVKDNMALDNFLANKYM